MASQFATKEERFKLNEIFKAFDKNHDGVLSREELIVGYTQIYGKHDRAVHEVDQILKLLDMNQSGGVDYSGNPLHYLFNQYLLEFLLATINIPGMLTRDKLQAAFQIFDPDGSGSITIDEILQVLNVKDSSPEDLEEWHQIISAIDKDGNGEISFDEFVQMMQKLAHDHR